MGKSTKSTSRSIVIQVICIAAMLSVFRLMLIHHYVGWRFLWGGDQVPVLNYEMFLKDVFGFKLPWRDLGLVAIPQLTLVLVSASLTKAFEFLTGPRIPFNEAGWLTNTVLYFIGLLILWYAVSWLRLRTRTAALAAYTILALLMSYNPWSTIDTFKSYLGATGIRAFLAVALFAYYLRLIRFAAESRSLEKWELALIIAISLTLYTVSPSAAVRGFAFTALEFLLTLLFLLAAARRRTSFQKKLMLAAAVPTITTSVLIIIYMFSGYISLLHHRVQAYWGGASPPATQLHPRYATPADALIAWTSWIAHSNYMPYHSMYEKGLLAALLYVWPLMAIGLSLLIIGGKRTDRATRLQLLLLLVYVTIFVLWATAANPPFARLKEALLTRFPVLLKVLPPGISSGYIRLSYTFLIASSLSLLLDTARRKKRVLIMLTIIVLTLLITALPIFNGKVFGQYFNESIKGFLIPKSYRVLMDLKTRFYEHILLLPALPTYASTSWGWQGSTQWYHYLNTAILTRSLAAYSQYTDWSKIYSRLANPCLKLLKPKVLLTGNNIGRVTTNGAKLIRLIKNKSINMTIEPFNNKVNIIITLTHSLNISAYRFIEFKLCIHSMENVKANMLVFLVSGKVAGVHIIGKVNNNCIAKIYEVGKPDKPWPASKYNPAKITGIIIKMQISKTTSRPINISFYAAVSREAELCDKYIELLKQLNIKYIVIDNSITLPILTNIKYISEALSLSFKKIFEDNYLTIYETNITTAPVHIEPSAMFSTTYTRVLPTYIGIQVKKEFQYRARWLELCTPMLSQHVLPQPLTIKYIKPSSVSIIRMNKSLLCYNVSIDNVASANIGITYTGKIKLIYIAEIVLELLPLPLYTYVMLASFARLSTRGILRWRR